MDATGATTVFGLSSGAVITVEATRTLDKVQRAVVYEPPSCHDRIDSAGIARLGAEIARGDVGAALIDSLLTAGTAPGLSVARPATLPAPSPD